MKASLSLAGWRQIGPFAQTSQTPEDGSKKEGAATVDACGVAEFVTHAGVVLRVNGHVAADQEIGQRHGHEGALQDSACKAGRLGVTIQ